MIFSHMAYLSCRGLNSSILNNMFVNKRKESVRTLINITFNRIRTTDFQEMLRPISEVATQQ